LVGQDLKALNESNISGGSSTMIHRMPDGHENTPNSKEIGGFMVHRTQRGRSQAVGRISNEKKVGDLVSYVKSSQGYRFKDNHRRNVTFTKTEDVGQHEPVNTEIYSAQVIKTMA
jgi:hypothetical protein